MRIPLIVSTLIAILGLDASAKADASPGNAAAVTVSEADAARAERFLRNKHDEVRRILRTPDGPKRAEKLSTVLGEFLDYNRLAELSLDKEWNKQTERERERFVSLLRQLVERQYQRNMESTLDYRVTWAGTEPIENGVKVKSAARSRSKKREPPVTIDYSMSPTGDQWKVFDIFTDDVSLVKNYKRQFRRVIAREGWNGLIERMKKKLEEQDPLL